MKRWLSGAIPTVSECELVISCRMALPGRHVDRVFPTAAARKGHPQGKNHSLCVPGGAFELNDW